MYCSKCGEKIQNGDNFCANCGETVFGKLISVITTFRKHVVDE